MSSFAAHAAAGAAVYMACRRPGPASGRWLAACVVLAMLPDVDYLLWWGWRIHVDPRLTHSLVFCGLAAVCAGWWLRRSAPAAVGPAHLGALCVASGSHLLLDWLVGVHGLPLFWPLLAHEFSAPVGLLPSADRLDPSNYYLWRNLFIEAGVLLPALAAAALAWRHGWRALARRRTALLVPAWAGFVYWSVSLSR